MPIWETGKIKVSAQLGYTLIEILAVLIILGLISLLVFPRFESGEEKAYLKQIGKLIQADIQTVSEEAVVGKSEIGVEFFSNGYRFEIGDIEIKRVFDKYRFQWNFSGEAIEKKEEIVAAETFSAENDEDHKLDSLKLKFDSDGNFPEHTVQWATTHFAGSLVFKSDGSVSWDDAPQKI